MQDEIMNMLEADEIAEEAEDADVTLENGRNAGSKQQLQADPCLDKHCGAGRVCKVRRKENIFYTNCHTTW